MGGGAQDSSASLVSKFNHGRRGAAAAAAASAGAGTTESALSIPPTYARAFAVHQRARQAYPHTSTSTLAQAAAELLVDWHVSVGELRRGRAVAVQLGGLPLPGISACRLWPETEFDDDRKARFGGGGGDGGYGGGDGYEGGGGKEGGGDDTGAMSLGRHLWSAARAGSDLVEDRSLRDAEAAVKARWAYLRWLRASGRLVEALAVGRTLLAACEAKRMHRFSAELLITMADMNLQVRERVGHSMVAGGW